VQNKLAITFYEPAKPVFFFLYSPDRHSEVFPHFSQVLKIVAPKEMNAVNSKAKLRMVFASEFTPNPCPIYAVTAKNR
jgi:hypothetical protein